MSTPGGSHDYFLRPDKPITFHFNDHAILCRISPGISDR